ncbi:MAG TPA: phosphoribosylamine--glycine ligase [Chitinophagaceae bacterium]|nr:phosphoribosylamine--glycine ligase [Chitinophagaceae bacterium]
MNILILGAGGREHVLAWKISQSELCKKLFIAPGNAGTMQCGTNLPFSITDFTSIRECCVNEKIDMVIIGPEEPLVNGLVDVLRNDPSLPELMVIGPSKEAAQLEGSKSFAKAFMNRHAIPTAECRTFTVGSYTEGVEYLKAHSLPIVLKADGLAAGKGVVICQNHLEAVAEFELMLQRAKFGEAGKRVVVEEFLSGIELSMFVLTDGKNYLLLPEAKDYKRIGEGDIGLNTGGMGAISPVPFADEAFIEKVKTRIIEPTINGLQKEGLVYKGFIFFGLIKVNNAPYVIEYNCRLGDPEAEVIIPRIKNDLLQLYIATDNQQLETLTLEKDNRYATAIMVASGGYPNEYKKGITIHGLTTNKKDSDVLVFHAGTKQDGDDIITNGGRVVCATALSSQLDEAIYQSMEAIEDIKFEGKYFRRDIGYEFVKDLV